MNTDSLFTPVPSWTPPPRPEFFATQGRYARLDPLQPGHAPALIAAAEGADHIWKYLPYGPFDAKGYSAWIASVAGQPDPMFFAITDLETGQVGGVLSLMRINPEAGSIEVGHINLTPQLQQTRAATEALTMAVRWGFEAGYRRFEWKCDALNLGSRRAGQRLGLSYEGVFRQAAVVKGRNRDTAWFAAIDGEWPALRDAYDTWLDPANFDENGRQRQSLSALTAPILVARDPAIG
jgi:RimJ/RimL family protein N-acetyltransferase